MRSLEQLPWRGAWMPGFGGRLFGSCELRQRLNELSHVANEAIHLLTLGPGLNPGRHPGFEVYLRI